MRAGVAVATYNCHAGLGIAEFRADHVDNALLGGIDVEQGDAELVAILLQGFNLLGCDGIKNRSSPWFGRDITGMVFINHPTWTRADLPFGGVENVGLWARARRLRYSGVRQQELINVVPIDAPA